MLGQDPCVAKWHMVWETYCLGLSILLSAVRTLDLGVEIENLHVIHHATTRQMKRNMADTCRIIPGIIDD